MTPSQLRHSQLLKLRNARRLAWTELASGFAKLGLSAQRVTDETHERIVDAFRKLDPVIRLVRDDLWLDHARRLAENEFSIMVGDPWEIDVHPIARVAGPALADRLAGLADLFSSGFYLSDRAASRFLIVNFDEDSDSGEMLAESAALGL
jgi:hypothetical protein